MLYELYLNEAVKNKRRRSRAVLKRFSPDSRYKRACHLLKMWQEATWLELAEQTQWLELWVLWTWSAPAGHVMDVRLFLESSQEY